MPLLDLKTDLKSLKYGNDQQGGGNSGQPYITTDINKVGIFTRFDDGLIRGGFIGATAASAVDTIRIGKFFKDFPKGPLFIVKQVGLQLSNPKLEVKKGVTGFFQGQPTRIYNLGINTLAQIPSNAFGVHLNRHGLLPIQDAQTKYFSVALNNNDKDNNRLVKLKDKLIGTEDNIIDNYTSGPSSVYGIGRTIIKRRGDFIVVNQDVTENEWAIKGAKEAGINYRLIGHEGGTRDGYTDASRRITNFTILSDKTGSLFAPNSLFYKDGKSIQSVFNGRRNNTPLGLDDKNIITYESTLTNTILTSGNITSSLGSGLNAINNYPKISIDSSEIITGLNNNTVNYSNPALKTYTELRSQIEKQKLSGSFGIYGDITSINKNNNLNPSLNNNTEFLPRSTSNPIYFNGYSTVKINIPWNKITRELRIGSGKQDQINLIPIFGSSPDPLSNNTQIEINDRLYKLSDLVLFNIAALNGDNPVENSANFMIFRAYLTQLTDNTDPIWNPVRYVGRGEEFYIYGGFTRKIQIGFKVAALSAQEMEPMYQKLNYLIGNVMPDYTEEGLMRGPMVKMTVGNWIQGQDGILTSINYTVINDSPWEIAINGINEDKLLVLPHVVEVSLGFTPIGSQTKGINKVSAKSEITSHIAQNQNGYQYIK